MRYHIIRGTLDALSLIHISRMNIGQVLEVHLGMAANALGWKIMTPVFDGAHEEDIRESVSYTHLDVYKRQV